jgi:hypothetical protein
MPQIQDYNMHVILQSHEIADDLGSALWCIFNFPRALAVVT